MLLQRCLPLKVHLQGRWVQGIVGVGHSACTLIRQQSALHTLRQSHLRIPLGCPGLLGVPESGKPLPRKGQRQVRGVFLCRVKIKIFKKIHMVLESWMGVAISKVGVCRVWVTGNEVAARFLHSSAMTEISCNYPSPIFINLQVK